jgi:hypothetical protein
MAILLLLTREFIAGLIYLISCKRFDDIKYFSLLSMASFTTQAIHQNSIIGKFCLFIFIVWMKCSSFAMALR